MVTPPAPRLIAFMPWLRIKGPVSVSGVTFLPFKNATGQTDPRLSDLAPSLCTILSGYVDAKGRPIDNCVVVTVDSRTPVWSLEHAKDADHISQTSQLLTLAAIAKNKYNTMMGCYSNSANTLTVWQGFTEPAEHISVTTRRREGYLSGGGNRHGEVKFQVPLQSRFFDSTCVDEDLLAGLDVALQSGKSATMKCLLPALSFFDLANTDDGMMIPESELILMGSAFDQTLDANGAHNLCLKFGALFLPYGEITVEAGLASRPGIVLDAGPVRAGSQRQWFLHKKWIEELYDLRSRLVHSQTLTARTWGWNLLEHLTMAAFVFPLLVKVMLGSEGYYALTAADEIRCWSVDRLLETVNWGDDRTSGHTIWEETIWDVARQVNFQRVTAAKATRNPQPDDLLKER